jgi:D-lactate dehydrogenase (cytochrome)
VNPDDPVEMAEARRLNHRLVERALALGGTCTGEHGVGLGLEFMSVEHGEGLALMHALKRTLDSDGLMNPGKMGS